MVNPLTGRFTFGCFECTTRALAGSPMFYESAQSNAITPNYRSQLKAMFGGDWKEAHEAVRTWHDRIAAVKNWTN